jgi:hypothetical protein
MLYARFQTEESTFFCTILCVPPRTVRFEHESSTELVNGSRATQGEAPMPQPTDAGEKVAGPHFRGIHRNQVSLFDQRGASAGLA